MAYINKPQKKKDKRSVKEKSATQQLIHKLVYDTPIWKNLRKSMLMIHPLCQRCLKELAVEVHHIKPLTTCKDEGEILKYGFDSTNLMCLCENCHKQIHRDLYNEKRGN